MQGMSKPYDDASWVSRARWFWVASTPTCQSPGEFWCRGEVGGVDETMKHAWHDKSSRFDDCR